MLLGARPRGHRQRTWRPHRRLSRTLLQGGHPRGEGRARHLHPRPDGGGNHPLSRLARCAAQSARTEALTMSSIDERRGAAMQRLPPLPRVLFLLHNFYGVDVGTMADTLGRDAEPIAGRSEERRLGKWVESTVQ